MNYTVFIEGKNFEVSEGGTNQLLGFFTSVFVEANDPKEAKSIALRTVKEDPQFKSCFKKKLQPSVQVKLILETETQGKIENIGYTFFSMKDSVNFRLSELH